MRRTTTSKSNFLTKFRSATGLLCLDAYILACGGLMLGLLCPCSFSGEESYADELSSASTGSSTGTSVDGVISVAAPESVTINLSPDTTTGVFNTASAEVSVGTNNSTGYSLYVNTTGLDGAGDTTTSLVHTSDSNLTISTLSTDTTLADFQSTSHMASVNKWGYTTNNNGTNTEAGQIPVNTYKPASTDNTLIKKTDTASSSSSTTVTFGAKVDANIPAGDYVNTVTFSAVANYVPTPLRDGVSMQDPKISKMCEDTPVWNPDDPSTQVTYKLKDIRDNKEYAVRKLNMGDGTAKCWMVQNLAYAQTNTTLSPDTSDVASGSTYKTPNSITTTKFTTGSNPQYSGDNNNEMHYDDNTAAYQAGITSSKGAYYSWYVATAGTGTNTMQSTSTSQSQATASICPKGWHLPYSDGTTTNTNEFYAIYNAYGANHDGLDAAYPLTLAGSYYSGGLDASGTYGLWWSNVAYTDAQRAYYMRADSSGVDPVRSNVKYNGHSVRCVLRP